SYFLSSTLVPILVVWMERHSRQLAAQSADGAFPRFRVRYSRLIRSLVNARLAVITVYLLAAALVLVLLAPRLGRESFRQADAGQLQLRVRAHAGARIEATEKTVLRALDLIGAEAGGKDRIAASIGLVGVHAPSYPINLIYLWNAGSHEAVLQVQFKDGSG